MRKFFVGFMALALLGVFVAPNFASAAPDVQLTGIFRWRGVTADETDQNDRAHDSRQLYDSLVRMRWTMKSEGSKVWAIYELDFQSGNQTIGSLGGGRVPVGVNRWLVDFMVPGTSLRARFGKTDWRDPTTEFIGGAGRNRVEGFGAYGKLYGPVSLSLWTTKTAEGVTAASDIDGYYLGLPWKAAPAITVTPWIYWEHDNAGATGSTTNPDHDYWWFALNFKGKFGIADTNITAIWLDGENDFSRGSAAPDTDVEGWAVRTKTWLSFGKLKVGFYTYHASGDDDATTATGRSGLQSDNKLERFVGPRNNGAGRLDGPQLVTSRRYSTFRVGFAKESRAGNGTGGANANGMHMYEILLKYQLTKALQLMGNVSLVRSAAERANIDLNNDGDSLDAGETTYDSDKDIGTEVDLSLKYSIYKSLWTRLTFAYFFAGDYGRLASTAGVASTTTRDADDTWAVYSEIRHTFKSK